jgi:glutamyl-tRNA synthetase
MWAWLSARSPGGQILMRIEDLETPRVKPGVTEKMLDDLRWLGFDWDHEPVFQTRRRAYYSEIFARLRTKDAIYPCICTRGEMLAAVHSAPHAGEHELRYPGTCRQRAEAEVRELAQRSGREFAWRLKTASKESRFDDLLFGEQRIDVAADVGDFIVARAADNPAYQLAVVADDIATGVNEVVRGDDLIPSTARQLLLYDLLGEPVPRYGHAPLIVGPDGKRLAKRHGDARIATLREKGVRPERIIGALAQWSGLIEERDASLRELLPLWSWNKVNRDRIVMTPEMRAQF